MQKSCRSAGAGNSTSAELSTALCRRAMRLLSLCSAALLPYDVCIIIVTADHLHWRLPTAVVSVVPCKSAEVIALKIIAFLCIFMLIVGVEPQH